MNHLKSTVILAALMALPLFSISAQNKKELAPLSNAATLAETQQWLSLNLTKFGRIITYPESSVALKDLRLQGCQLSFDGAFFGISKGGGHSAPFSSELYSTFRSQEQISQLPDEKDRIATQKSANLKNEYNFDLAKVVPSSIRLQKRNKSDNATLYAWYEISPETAERLKLAGLRDMLVKDKYTTGEFFSANEKVAEQLKAGLEQAVSLCRASVTP
jgi:hypothetical protein